MLHHRFRPKAWAFALTCVVVVSTIALGNWQRGRADEKIRLAERRAAGQRDGEIPLPAGPAEAQALLWRRVVVAGEWIATRTVFLDNRLREGRPGFEVITPLRLAGESTVVLVNRGWLPLLERRADMMPQVSTPTAPVRLSGVVVPRIDRVFAPGESPSGPVRLNLDVAEYGREAGLPLLPVVIEQHSDAADGLARNWPAPDAGAERNISYAWQWYSFGLLAAVLFLVLSMEKHER